MQLCTAVLVYFALVVADITAGAAMQHTFKTSSASEYHSGLFTPLEDLRLLSSSQFTLLTHPLHPGYDVRIKKSRFCDETVK